MKNSISNKIYNHLEFLGYKVEDISGDSDLDTLVGKHGNRSNLILRIAKNDTILVSARYRVSKTNKIINDKFLNVLNSVNSKSLFTKWYYEEDEDNTITLCIETFALSYEKQAFGNIVDTLEGEVLEYMKEFTEFSE
ncbi:MAG: hypothetical protein H6767_08525 [Candidatus Peribacteria bacterium]|nr:MAG: hypothetical protein H6767_08525 [Candidatus Peribacteria bacterium]